MKKRQILLLLVTLSCILLLAQFFWGCESGGSSGGDPVASPSSSPSVIPTESPGPSPSPSPGLVSDFEPPSGADTTQSGYGPWNKRLLIATSTDGLNFTRANRIVTDQADVPDLIRNNDGRLFLYYTGWTVGNEKNKTCVAISDDNGNTWVYKKVVLSGFSGMADPVDPDVQILADGTYRLYITSDPNDGNGPRTYYAEGTDGISFTKKGLAFQVEGKEVLDPSTIKIGETWHLYAGGVPKRNYHATSSDGKTFTYQGLIDLTIDSNSYLMDNGINDNGTNRYYCFYDLGQMIKSFVSNDGTTWTVESGNRLVADVSSGLETDKLVGVAVTKLKNGTYLMIYAVVIP